MKEKRKIIEEIENSEAYIACCIKSNKEKCSCGIVGSKIEILSILSQITKQLLESSKFSPEEIITSISIGTMDYIGDNGKRMKKIDKAIEKRIKEIIDELF